MNTLSNLGIAFICVMLILLSFAAVCVKALKHEPQTPKAKRYPGD